MAKFDHSDESVVVIIGSGAGGGTLANELCQKGIKVVSLEAGARQSTATFIQDEWKSFSQLAWLDPRTTSGDWRIAKDFSGLASSVVYCLPMYSKVFLPSARASANASLKPSGVVTA